MSLSAPCTTLSRIAGIERTRTLPPSFGISCLRAGSGCEVRPISSSRNCSSRTSTPCVSMASKVTPSIPGAPSFFLAISYAARRVSILQTWTYSPQNRQDGSAFALTYILRLRSCKSMDAFVISSLPSPMLETLQMAGPLGSADITPLLRYYGPSRPPLVFGRLPGFAGSTASLAPTISRRDEEGFSSCLACPCHRAVASTPPRQRCRIGQISAPHVAFALRLRARPSVSLIFEATFAFTVVTARWLVISPRETLSIGFRVLVSLHPAIQTTRLLTLAPAGLSPAEHTSLRWTHNRTGRSPASGSRTRLHAFACAC